MSAASSREVTTRRAPTPTPWPTTAGGACPICRLEMDRLAQLDGLRRLSFVDVATPGFDASAYGGALEDMQRLHKDGEGRGQTRGSCPDHDNPPAGHDALSNNPLAGNEYPSSLIDMSNVNSTGHLRQREADIHHHH